MSIKSIPVVLIFLLSALPAWAIDQTSQGVTGSAVLLYPVEPDSIMVSLRNRSELDMVCEGEVIVSVRSDILDVAQSSFSFERLISPGNEETFSGPAGLPSEYFLHARVRSGSAYAAVNRLSCRPEIRIESATRRERTPESLNIGLSEAEETQAGSL